MHPALSLVHTGEVRVLGALIALLTKLLGHQGHPHGLRRLGTVGDIIVLRAGIARPRLVPGAPNACAPSALAPAIAVAQLTKNPSHAISQLSTHVCSPV